MEKKKKGLVDVSSPPQAPFHLLGNCKLFPPWSWELSAKTRLWLYWSLPVRRLRPFSAVHGVCPAFIPNAGFSLEHLELEIKKTKTKTKTLFFPLEEIWIFCTRTDQRGKTKQETSVWNPTGARRACGCLLNSDHLNTFNLTWVRICLSTLTSQERSKLHYGECSEQTERCLDASFRLSREEAAPLQQPAAPASQGSGPSTELARAALAAGRLGQNE